MNLKGLFQRLKLPLKGGKKASKSSGIRTVRRYSLEFSNIENTPSYALETCLSVGSEVGDIIIEDESLSPRHATFTLENDVVTVMDLGSSQGTTIGDHALTKGKAVILKAEDELMLGQLQVVLRVSEEEIAADESAPEEQEEDAAPAEEEAPKETPVKETAPSEEVVRPEDKIKKRLEEIRSKTKGKGSAHKVIGGGSNSAANVLPRVMGAFIDVLLVMTLWHLLSPFTEFKELLEVLPQALQDHVLPEIEKLIAEQGFGDIYQSGMKSFLEMVADAERDLSLSHIVSLYFSFRLLATLLFGMTFGSWLAGVRAYGNVLWKRLGGVIRELLAWVTWPVLLLDITTLFSRRSLREVITFTHLYTPSKGVVMISWLLFIPLSLALFLVSPMFSGLVVPEPVLLQEVMSKKLPKAEQSGELKTYASQWFNLQFMLPQNSWRVLPRFSWSQDVRGKTLTPTLVFYHESGTTVPIVLHRRFDWVSLLETALAHNPPLQSSFPNLWAYAQSEKVKGSTIKYRPSPADRLKFQEELQELIKVSFALSPDNLIEHVQTYGVLLRGLIEFRQAMFALVGVPDDGAWQLVRYGKSTMLLHEVMGVKPYDLIVPLVFGEGRLFKVSYASTKERTNGLKVLKELWGRSAWEVAADAHSEGASTVIDVVADLAQNKETSDAAFEKIYGAYFEAAGHAVQAGSAAPIHKATLQAIKNLNEVLVRLLAQKSMPEVSIEGMKKLQTKLLEVQGQLESLNASFFVTEQSTTQPVSP